MQPAEMMRGTRAVYNLVLLISISVAYVHSYPLQILPSIPGYIPVYIRYGDQPLEEINPALAEAFHEGGSSKSLNLDKIPNAPGISPEEDEASKYNVYAIDVRQANNRFVDKGEDKKSTAKAAGIKAAEPPASSNKGRRRQKLRRKKPSPVVKVSPLTEEKKEELENYHIEATEDIKSLNEMLESKKESQLSKSRHESEESDNEENSEPTKVDQIIFEDSDFHLGTNSKSSSVSLDEEVPTKLQAPLGFLSNVHKITPSPEISMELGKERTEKEPLKEKSN